MCLGMCVVCVHVCFNLLIHSLNCTLMEHRANRRVNRGGVGEMGLKKYKVPMSQ